MESNAFSGWKEYYDSHKISAREAVQLIKSGDTVVVAHASGEPSAILDAMVANKTAYRNVELIHFVCMGKGEYCLPENKDYFRHNSWFAGGITRQAIADGRADFTPVYLSQSPGQFRKMKGSLDVFLGHVSPPDKNGFCSFGVSVDYERAAMESAALKIVQVNPQMPRALGDSFVHVSEIDCFVEHDAPIIELGRTRLTDVEKSIGKNCASLIRDGDTLQLGIGSLPDAVLLFLKDKKDLGIHSEMISDGVMELMKAGVITNRRKNFHTGKAVVTFAMGSREFYEFMDDNPIFQVMGSDYVNDPYIIGKNDNMVSINSSVEVDFSGQLCSESVGPKQISGTGGQVDFIRGAGISKGGRSIIVIYSTAQGGKKSKIVPGFEAGTIVTCGRCEPDYIVTEYGIAQLKGKCVRQRAKDLIKIAHPGFREELAAAWEEMFKMKLDRAEILP